MTRRFGAIACAIAIAACGDTGSDDAANTGAPTSGDDDAGSLTDASADATNGPTGDPSTASASVRRSRSAGNVAAASLNWITASHFAPLLRRQLQLPGGAEGAESFGSEPIDPRSSARSQTRIMLL